MNYYKCITNKATQYRNKNCRNPGNCLEYDAKMYKVPINHDADNSFPPQIQ